MATVKRSQVVLFIVLLCFLSPSLIQTDGIESTFHQEAEVESTSGRQAGVDPDCTGLTFEDLFEYDYALFSLVILDDWATADMTASAWVNGSNSATVRENLDMLFDGLPGGNNSYISTDERDAVRAFGPSCIEDMETRVGLREGEPHTGEVSWNNFTFVGDGIALDEVNLVPTGHPESRSCTNFGANADCKEVPVTVTDDLEIHLSSTPDLSNMEFVQLPNQGSSNFTMAMNISNMTSGLFEATFPFTENLRVAGASMIDINDGVRGELYNLDSLEVLDNDNDQVQIRLELEFDRTQWDTERYIFVDFTTSERIENIPPVWTADSPQNNTKAAISSGTQTVVAASNTLNSWGQDLDGWTMTCNFQSSDWTSMIDQNGQWVVTHPADSSGVTNANCSLVDDLGLENSEERVFQFGQLFSMTGELSSDSKDIEVGIAPTDFVSSFDLTAHAHQVPLNDMGAPASLTVQGGVPASMTLSLNGVKPGDIMVMGVATSTGMLDYAFMNNIDVEKPNSIPLITLQTNLLDNSNATWDSSGLVFVMRGNYVESDGESVSFSYSLCAFSSQGFITTSNSWEVDISIAPCSALGISNYVVEITATDESGGSYTILAEVTDPFAEIADPTTPEPKVDDEDSGLPSVSLFATLCMIGLAVMNKTRRDES